MWGSSAFLGPARWLEVKDLLDGDLTATGSPETSRPATKVQAALQQAGWNLSDNPSVMRQTLLAVPVHMS